MILPTGSGSTIYYTQDNSNQHTIRSMSFHTSTLHPLSFEDIRKLLNEFYNFRVNEINVYET